MKRKQRSDAESFGLILNSEWYAPSEMISPPRHGQQTLRGIRWKRAYGGHVFARALYLMLKTFDRPQGQGVSRRTRSDRR